MTKYIIVCGGTATGTGKTIFTASLGYIFSTFNLITTIIKVDIKVFLIVRLMRKSFFVLTQSALS